ncbi:MAG: NAD(P)/FAD-dependent oxidoreductase [Theionarchaea archaeon]|nr:NAD(P)/FAD-dependent oxidoreductase [Theionarchaea archaeon]
MDIIIAGGGITGCYAGQLLKRKGFNPLIIEEHPEIGKPMQCAGLIGRETVETSHIPFPEPVIMRRIDGARFYLGNEWFEIERAKSAYVIDRAGLDIHFSKGLDINTREKVLTFKKDDTIQVTTDKGMYTCDVLLGCDGPFSVVRKTGDFSVTTSFYSGVQYTVELPPEDDFVELHVKPPFFFWFVPETAETTRIGFIGLNPVHQLDRFLERKEINKKILNKQAGVISLGYGDIATRRIALLGDAACQVKPLTGGGIFYGMKAVEIVINHLHDLSGYEKEWKEKFGREIKMGLKLRKVYEDMSSKSLKRVFRIFKENKNVIEDIADFERHSSVVKELIKHPMLWKLVGSVVKEVLTYR